MKVRIEIRPSDFEGNAWYRCCHKDESSKKRDDGRQTTDDRLPIIYALQKCNFHKWNKHGLKVCRPSSVVRRPLLIIYVIFQFPASIPNNKRNYKTFTPLLHPSAFGHNRFFQRTESRSSQSRICKSLPHRR